MPLLLCCKVFWLTDGVKTYYSCSQASGHGGDGETSRSAYTELSFSVIIERRDPVPPKWVSWLQMLVTLLVLISVCVYMSVSVCLSLSLSLSLFDY